LINDQPSHNLELVVSYPQWLDEILRCPQTGERLRREGHAYVRADGKAYPIVNGVLSIVYPGVLGAQDATMNKLYRWLAPLYDLNERIGGRLLCGVDMVAGRRRIVELLGLRAGMRLLEVSPGPGVFQPFLRQDLREEGRIVALDLSMPMLRQCQARNKCLEVHLVHGNASHLPFADASFDGLFHFGGVNLFSEPEKALAEFVRVVRSDGLVSYGDEGFGKSYPHSMRRRILAKINPGFVKPRPTTPNGISDIKEHEVYGGLGYLVVARRV
jgi:ubiquinone/menaquinone biosynthesis C-methylase UbiE